MKVVPPRQHGNCTYYFWWVKKCFIYSLGLNIYIYTHNCIFTYNKGVHEKIRFVLWNFIIWTNFQKLIPSVAWGDPALTSQSKSIIQFVKKCTFFTEGEDLSERSQNCSNSFASLTQFPSSLFIYPVTILKMILSWWLQFEQMIKFTFGHIMFS